jgi:hypothetical protein
VGARYALAEAGIGAIAREAIDAAGVTIIEVPVGDSNSIRAMGVTSALREGARSMLGHSLVSGIRKLTGR